MLKSPPPARNAAHDKRRLVLDTNVIVLPVEFIGRVI